jgi:hypothetical protein
MPASGAGLFVAELFWAAFAGAVRLDTEPRVTLPRVAGCGALAPLSDWADPVSAGAAEAMPACGPARDSPSATAAAPIAAPAFTADIRHLIPVIKISS